MLRRIFSMILVGVSLALITVRHGRCISSGAPHRLGLVELADRLPSLAENSQVHFEPGAENYAHEVPALLPAAIARIEAAHGRPFARPVTVGVYATPEAYAAANVVGSVQPVGVTAFGRVNLSPALDWPLNSAREASGVLPIAALPTVTAALTTSAGRFRSWGP